MIVVFLLLILVSFLQSTVLPFQLILIILVCYSFMSNNEGIYMSAFSLGLLNSFLANEILGPLSIFYLLTVKIISMLKKSSFLSKWYLILPICLVVLISYNLFRLIFYHEMIDWRALFVNLIWVFPIYAVVYFWEDRFVPKKEVRLKLNK